MKYARTYTYAYIHSTVYICTYVHRYTRGELERAHWTAQPTEESVCEWWSVPSILRTSYKVLSRTDGRTDCTHAQIGNEVGAACLARPLLFLLFLAQWVQKPRARYYDVHSTCTLYLVQEHSTSYIVPRTYEVVYICTYASKYRLHLVLCAISRQHLNHE